MRNVPARRPRNWGNKLTKSFGLRLYALARRAGPVARVERPARPAGQLVWLNAPSTDAARPLIELGRRLRDQKGTQILLTCPDVIGAQAAASGAMIVTTPPADSASEARDFLDHWRPQAGVFADGALRPALIHEATDRGIPLMMVDAHAPRSIHRTDVWLPGLTRGALAGFRRIFCLDREAADAMIAAGAPAARVFVSGRMEEASAVLRCLEAEREMLSRQINTRPVWLAAAVPECEEDAVIFAHREVMKMSHRLLLILVPENSERSGPLAQRMEQTEGWIVAQRRADEEPGAETEVFVIDDQAEMGLWYRLASVSFLGGSLSGEGCLRNPLEPAALGSSMIFGPRPGAWQQICGRLGAARAARSIASPRDLAEALADLQAPDRAAHQAQAAWAVASEGAEVTERVLQALQQILAEAG
jgi:3-deoxy-D-manno-octulosonic-acid transferase